MTFIFNPWFVLSFSVITILCQWVRGYKHEAVWILADILLLGQTFCLKKGGGEVCLLGQERLIGTTRYTPPHLVEMFTKMYYIAHSS